MNRDIDARYEDALSDLSTARLCAQAKLFSWESDGRDLLAVQMAEFTLKLARSELADCLPIEPPFCEPEFPDDLCAFHSLGGEGPCGFCEGSDE
jgi:hypothetical protein